MDPRRRLSAATTDSWQASPDGLTYTFRLRDGLKFHDGQPVRAADAVASIKRWGQRNDAYGQALLAAATAIEVVDDRSFRIVLRGRFPVLEAARHDDDTNPVHHARAPGADRRLHPAPLP